MTQSLPRVTYSNIGVDFSPVHDFLDEILPGFEKNELGRQWEVPFATGSMHSVKSPIHPSISLGSFPTSTSADVDAAIAASKQAAISWRVSSLEERLAFAARWRDMLEDEKYRLGLAALYEVGKSRLEAIGEAEEAVDMLDYYPSELRDNNGFVRSMNELVEFETATSVLKPYGVFAVIAPFNFPLALSIGMIAGALITGNTVVFKPSPECQLTGLLIAETLQKAGLPEGVFSIVLGGADVGQGLSQHPDIDGVAFTGSHNTGMSIFRHMATQPWMKPVIAEMGGKNPTYVTANADLDRAAQGVVRSAFGLQGQKCSACSVVYVDNAVKNDFIARCVAFAEKLNIGDPRERDTFMGPLYSEAATKRFASSVAQARSEGIVHFGGQPIEGKPENYFSPAIVEMHSPSNLTRDELFMPFVVVRGVTSLESGVTEGNSVAYGLSAGIFTRDEEELNYFLNNAQAGVLYANRASGATTGAWPGAQPFCGWKGTGVSGKGGLGAYFLPQFMREQSHTIMTR
ncbi:aldehyde dehydrogenase family protein [Ochrobactrum sp. BTU1]|uniref:aldehyde dehydrogenase family protein n=1 Tax=Ochrobactrum sp. BTU1 TaxID=2840456 RepID=UPI001C049641|nr:aldehyde dehydrogenase family protein [Ochrobactrum sp. BTU1]